MKSCPIAAVMLFLSVPVQSGLAAPARLFTLLAGDWAGSGTVQIVNGAHEPFRCRGRYSAPDENHIHLQLLCASDSFKLAIGSDIARQGDTINGTWREATYGVSGQVSGFADRDGIDATIEGLGLSARLTMRLRGSVQLVTLTSRTGMEGSASVRLHRS